MTLYFAQMFASYMIPYLVFGRIIHNITKRNPNWAEDHTIQILFFAVFVIIGLIGSIYYAYKIIWSF